MPTVFSLPCRRVARAGIDLPVLGLGTRCLGNPSRAVSDQEAVGVLRHAFDLGMSYLDTAPHYGHGLSERRIGMVSAPVAISTQVGRVLPAVGTARHGFADADPRVPAFDYTYEGVMHSFAASCRRLGRDRIDIVFAHDLGEMTHGVDLPLHFKAFMEGGYRALTELKASGQIRAIGLGVNDGQICRDVLSHADLDVVLLAGRYTLLEQGALDTVLPECERRGVGVIVGGPFNSGALVDGNRHEYQPIAAPVTDRVAALKVVCRSHGVSIAAAALQFSLGHPNVVSVIPGMASRGQVEANLMHVVHRIPDQLWDDLKSLDLLRADAPTPKHIPA